MNIRNNKMILFLAAVLFVLLLSACGSSSKSSEDTLKVWTMSEGFKDFVKEYEEESGMKIDVQTIPWSSAHDKLVTAVGSGKGPDVFQIGNTWVAEFAEAGTFLDLAEYVDDYENFNPDHFYESAVATTEVDGEVIGIPWYVDTRLLYYRKDILEDLGYPDGPETWDDLLDISEQLTADGEKDQFAVDLPGEGRYGFILGWSNGWDYEVGKGAENFEKPEFKQGLEIFNEFYENHYSQVGEGKELVQAFSDGSKPMFFSGPWDLKTIADNAPELEGKWAVTVMPKTEEHYSEMGGAHLAVFNNTEKVEESLDFINWMAKPETQVKWYETFSELPANMNAWDDPVLKDNEFVSAFGEQLELTKAVPLIPEYEKMSNDLADSLEKILRGNQDVDEALEEYIGKVERLLEE